MYNKLFTKILDSSIWLEPTTTRLVWITLIAAMDQDGFAQFAAIGNLANRARVSLEDTAAALKKLEAPDTESSDPENDGRRVERVPGGWMVLNSGKYKEMATSEISRQKTRQRLARFREKKRLETVGDVSETERNDQETPSETETETETETKSTDSPPTGGGPEAKAPAGKPWLPSDVHLRLGRLFKRRDTTRWSESEQKAFKKLGEIDPEDLDLVETYYRESIPEKSDYRRRDLQTLLNNWNGELDRARMFKPNKGY